VVALVAVAAFVAAPAGCARDFYCRSGTRERTSQEEAGRKRAARPEGAIVAWGPDATQPAATRESPAKTTDWREAKKQIQQAQPTDSL
jgi:hypothetical protein